MNNFETFDIFNEKSDLILEGVAWEIAETRDNLLHNLLKYSEMMHFYNDYEDGDLGKEGLFGENDENDKNNYPEIYQKNQKLSNIVKTCFKDIKIYWIGDGEIDVYIVGEIDTGDWIGINTKLIQT